MVVVIGNGGFIRLVLVIQNSGCIPVVRMVQNIKMQVRTLNADQADGQIDDQEKTVAEPERQVKGHSNTGLLRATSYSFDCSDDFKVRRRSGAMGDTGTGQEV